MKSKTFLIIAIVFLAIVLILGAITFLVPNHVDTNVSTKLPYEIKQYNSETEQVADSNYSAYLENGSVVVKENTDA